MKALLVGGAGYIGYSLTKQILEGDNPITELVIYDNLSRNNYGFFTYDKFKGKPIQFIKGELLDSRKLKQSLQGVDVVIHLAAKVTTPYADSDSHFFDQINHWGTATLANAVEESEVKHFIHLSSMSVYGSSDTPVDENHEPAPESFYGISKLQAEEQVTRLKNQMNVHILRSANVYGYNPTMRIDAVFNRFMFEANFNNRVTIHGNGEQSRTFIHVEKLAYIIECFLKQNIPLGIYNIVEHNLSVNDVVAQIQEFYPDLETLYVSRNMRMRQIQAITPCKIFDHIELPHKNMQEEIEDFKRSFAF
ncbi:MAG: NAD-dependent epimerase/dehydratase family protein [Flammeovirgaceae bacterium]